MTHKSHLPERLVGEHHKFSKMQIAKRAAATTNELTHEKLMNTDFLQVITNKSLEGVNLMIDTDVDVLIHELEKAKDAADPHQYLEARIEKLKHGNPKKNS